MTKNPPNFRQGGKVGNLWRFQAKFDGFWRRRGGLDFGQISELATYGRFQAESWGCFEGWRARGLATIGAGMGLDFVM